MNDALQIGWGLIQGLVLLIVAPGLLGLIRWVKARAQGRPRDRAALWQPYRDLLRLARQPAVRSGRTTWVFAVVPVVLWTCYATLAFAVPFIGQRPLVALDLIALVYLLAFARFALALAGLDAGAPFAALGSGRAMFLSVPTELALVLIAAALVLHWHRLDLMALVELQRASGAGYLLHADLVLIAIALYLTLALQASRLPSDNPDSRQALTLGQRGIMLEYGGRDLAIIEWAESIKLAALLGLFASLFLAPVLTTPSVAWFIVSAILFASLFLVARLRWRIILFTARFPVARWSRRFIVWLPILLLAFLYSHYAIPALVPLGAALPGSVKAVLTAVTTLVVILAAVFVLARSEVPWPKVRLRKAPHRAVLAVGFSLAAILYRVVADLGVIP